MADIDPDLLPEKCLLDTGVLIRALGQRQDAESEVCRDFFDAMLLAKKIILVAAPTVAEMLRGNPQKLPRTRSIIVVAFDREAAELLGTEIPVAVLKETAKTTGLPHTYMKFDGMIVACAKRWQADCIVALDSDHTKLASHISMTVNHPRDFLVQQTVLPFKRKSSQSGP